ncbi:MAG: hypothetical protein AAF351_16010 [Pseudomonadota bacterium]
MTLKVITAIIGALFVVSALADETAPAAFRVDVEVTVPDEDLRERVAVYLRSELRGLGDVEVTSENPDFKIYSMVSEVKTSTGDRIAYVLGTSITSFFPDGYFDSVLDNRMSNVDEVARLLEAVTVYRNQFISVSGPNEVDLLETAANSVATFNAHILEPERNR